MWEEVFSVCAVFVLICLLTWAISHHHTVAVSAADWAAVETAKQRRAIAPRKRHECRMCNPNCARKRVNIVVFEGGGAREVIPTEILVRISEHFPDIFDHVDVFAGTSAGGLSAASAGMGYLPTEIRDFARMGSQCLTRSWVRCLTTWNGLLLPRYNDNGRRDQFEAVFGEETLGDLMPHVVLPCLQVASWQSPVFHPLMYTNLPNSHSVFGPKPMHSNSPHNESSFSTSGQPFRDPNYRNLKLREICLRTTAAPGLFEIQDGQADAGVFANDSSMLAVGLCVEAGIPLEDICVLTLSSGVRSHPDYPDHDVDWGALQWLRRLIPLVLRSGQIVTSNFCRSFLHERFHYCAVPIADHFSVDYTKDMDGLIKVARDYDIEPTLAFVRDVFLKYS